MKMREEMDNKLETIVKELRTNKCVPTVTNHAGSKINEYTGVRSSNIENSDSENEDYRLKASEMKDFRHPVKTLYRNELDLDATIVSKDDSEEYIYHRI